MIYIQHRVNTLAQLSDLNPDYGAEIDIRSDPSTGSIYLHHDPFVLGESFSDWAALFVNRGIRGPVILNTKEDGLERALIQTCHQYGINNFFFLDTALPTLVKWSVKEQERRFACRLSVYEPLAAIAAFRGLVDWLWIDCFDGLPLPTSVLPEIKGYFKLCLVAPELQGVSQVDPVFGEWIKQVDAICTKRPNFWRR